MVWTAGYSSICRIRSYVPYNPRGGEGAGRRGRPLPSGRSTDRGGSRDPPPPTKRTARSSVFPTGFGPGPFYPEKNGTPKLFDKPVRDAGGDPTAVLRYADRMGMVKRESERTIRKNVRIGKLQLRCVIIQIPNEEESVLLQLLQLQPKKGKKIKKIFISLMFLCSNSSNSSNTIKKDGRP